MQYQACVCFFMGSFQTLNISFDDAGPSMSVNPPAVTISAFNASAFCKIYSDKNLARSALFSGRSMNCFQFVESGTSPVSMILRIGRLADPARLCLAPVFIEAPS